MDDKITQQLAVIKVEIFAVYLERGKTKIQFYASHPHTEGQTDVKSEIVV